MNDWHDLFTMKNLGTSCINIYVHRDIFPCGEYGRVRYEKEHDYHV